ncbi:unnamed protein product [Danaus chrysippus]|uniref:(African queen) hypothetical protein n=1 Tax=Danaus chrysippus TaxID=151541 RepID=A0A8J2QL43_9NEOP|nr:unnamed protein product [Danaus chrysippus]
MSDTLQDGESSTRSNSLKISLPTVLYTDTADTETPQTNFNESKHSLPSSFGASTLLLSSPVSLPTSPTPFTKTPLQSRSNRSLDEPTDSKHQQNTQSKPIINTGSSTVMPCCGCWWNGRQRHRPPETVGG